MDVKTTFLRIDFEDTIYLKQLNNFEEDKSKMCILNKYLYVLKQIHRQWYHRFDEFLLNVGFVRSDYDNCILILNINWKVSFYLLLYVDDVLLVSSRMDEIRTLKKKLNGEFDMKDHGFAKRILVIQIV